MIHLYDKYHLDADAHGWRIGTMNIYKSSKTGEPVEHFNSVGYYSSLQSALSGVYECATRDAVPECETLSDLIAECGVIREELEKAIKVALPEVTTEDASED